MNYTLNDRDQLVYAVGAPGSIERMRVEYPELIAQLNGLCAAGVASADAAEMIRVTGIQSALMVRNILLASGFREEDIPDGK